MQSGCRSAFTQEQALPQGLIRTMLKRLPELKLMAGVATDYVPLLVISARTDLGPIHTETDREGLGA